MGNGGGCGKERNQSEVRGKCCSGWCGRRRRLGKEEERSDRRERYREKESWGEEWGRV